MPPEGRARLERWLPVMRRATHAAGQYRRRLLGDLASFAWASVIVMVLYAVALYGVQLWWTVFRETPLGERFMDFFVERASAIETFLAQPIWEVTGKIYLAGAAAGLAVGAVSQVLLLKHYLYDFAGCLVRVVVWGGATVVVATMFAAAAFSLELRNALLITAAPALGMFASCTTLAARLLPKITTVGWGVVAAGDAVWRVALRRWRRD